MDSTNAGHQISSLHVAKLVFSELAGKEGHFIALRYGSYDPIVAKFPLAHLTPDLHK